MLDQLFGIWLIVFAIGTIITILETLWEMLFPG